MTAIVGVLNTQAAVIAADSAMTISEGETIKKVFNYSNKIFTLSKYHPVGIAVYNNLSFMGVPWETIIKQYRRQLGKKSFNKISEYKDDFVNHIINNSDWLNTGLLNREFLRFCQVPYTEISSAIKNNLINQKNNIASLAAGNIRNNSIKRIFRLSIDQYLAKVTAYPKLSTISINYSQFKRQYQSILVNFRQELEAELSASSPNFRFSNTYIGRLNRILFELVSNKSLFEVYSGLVFIGFGEKEFFPSCCLVHSGIMVKDELRYLDVPALSRTIDGAKITAAIVPFANSTVTRTILSGIDPNMDKFVRSQFKAALKKVAQEASARMGGTPQQRGVGIQQLMQIVGNVSNLFDKQLSALKVEKYTRPVVNSLTHMSKEDIAELAESLIKITSLKMRFSDDDETVGGPVDVAVITKAEGLIWIKRKQYFDQEINQTFNNKYYQ